MPWLFKHELTIVLTMALLAVSASIFPTFYKAIRAPAGTYYTLEHNNLNDYYYYLSLMRQGYEGKWLVTSRHTAEKFPPMFAQTFLTALGRLGQLFGGSMALTYTIARVVLGFILLVLIYLFAKTVLREKTTTLLACFFAYFGTSFWYIKNGIFTTYLGFWTEFDAFWRATFLPHHLAGTIFVIASLLSLISSFPSPTRRRGIFFSLIFIVFGVLAGLANPASLLNYTITLSFAFFLIVILNLSSLYSSYFNLQSHGHTRGDQNGLPWCVKPANSLMIGIVKLAKVLPKGKWTILLGLVIFGLTLFYFAHLQNTVFPWTTYRDFSNTLHYPLSLSYYLLGLGPISYFALFSLPHLFQFLPSSLYPSSYILLFLLSWAISPFFSIFVLTPFTNLPNSHFFQAYHFIPLSILAAIGAKKTWEVTCWLADHGSNLSQFRTNKMVPLGLVGLLVIYFLIPWYQSIKASLSQYPGHPYNIYLPKELTTAFEFLNKNSTQEEVVLSGPFIGGLLPAYTHNRSLHGHPVNTYKVSLKNAQVDQFYKQNDVDFAKKLVEEYQISYVIFTFDAPQPDLSFVQALNLTPVYHNDRVSIYRTMKSPRAEPDTRRYLAEPVGFFRLRRISSAEAERASAFIHG